MGKSRRRCILNTSNKATRDAARLALIVSAAASFFAVAIATALGSVFVPPGDILAIVAHKAAGAALPDGIRASEVSIVWSLRLPRAILAFLAGATLSVSGAVMQSVLKNPLASSFTLGVSSGASLGAGLVIMCGLSLPFADFAAVPAAGLICGVLAIVAVLRFSRAIDPGLSNNTIILAGMVLSLFVNAILTLLSAFSRDGINRLIFWQMGSFAVKGWLPVCVLAPIAAIGVLAILAFARELDVMTFSDDEAAAIGVNVVRTRRTLVILASILTGCTVAFTGVIGFIDLVVPHAVRRALGPAHRTLIPVSALAGGVFMTLADLLARVLIPPLDLPVGAITAALGTPFFAWVYAQSRRNPA